MREFHLRLNKMKKKTTKISIKPIAENIAENVFVHKEFWKQQNFTTLYIVYDDHLFE